MTITKISILSCPGHMDVVHLHTDLPNACWPYDGSNYLSFPTTRGEGTAYVARHFPGVPVEIIDYP